MDSNDLSTLIFLHHINCSFVTLVILQIRLVYSYS